MAHTVLTGGYLNKLQIYFANYLGTGVLLINVLTAAQDFSSVCTHSKGRKLSSLFVGYLHSFWSSRQCVCVCHTACRECHLSGLCPEVSLWYLS